MLLYGVLEETHDITAAMVETTANELQQDLEGGAQAGGGWTDVQDHAVPARLNGHANGHANGSGDYALFDLLNRVEALEQQMAAREQVFRRLTHLLGVTR